MKILQILTELGPGGAERVVLDLSGELIAEGHSVSVISLKSPPENKTIPDSFRAMGIVPEYLHFDSPRDFMRLFSLRAKIKKFAPDIIHSHLVHPNLLARLASIGLGIPLVNSVHISERRSGQGLLFLLDRLTFPLCSICTAVSNASARFQEKKLGLPENTIRVVYNGVDPVPRPDAGLLRKRREEWEMTECSRIIGSIGRLDPQKGFDLFLRCFPALSKKVPHGEKWGVVILGEGAQRSELEALASAVPENIKVVLPGFFADARSMIWMFDCFVMPSRYEGYGLVLAEAMTTGVPAVVSPADSLPELCRLYPNGTVVSFENGKNTAEAVVKAVLSSRSEPCLICSRKEMAERYLEIYRNVSSI